MEAGGKFEQTRGLQQVVETRLDWSEANLCTLVKTTY
jgi:hypothetical protein